MRPGDVRTQGIQQCGRDEVELLEHQDLWQDVSHRYRSLHAKRTSCIQSIVYPTPEVQPPQSQPPRSIGFNKFADSKNRFNLGASCSRVHARVEAYATVIGTA